MAIHANRSLPTRFGRWAVVTGASDGIGMAFARQLAEAGFNLVLVARRRAVLDRLATDLADRHGIACRVVARDLSAPDAIATIDTQTADLDIGILVAAAGFGTAGPFLAIDAAAERTMIDLNCKAVVDLVRLHGERMAARGRGGIVLMSSLVAFQGVPRAATYAATKAFVQVFAEGIGREFASLGIAVVASAPGPVASGFAARAGMTMSMSAGPDIVARQTLAALGRRRTVRPGRLAKLLEAMLAPLPRSGRTLIMQRVMAGMTRQPAVPAGGGAS